jgi:hypothetical protein
MTRQQLRAMIYQTIKTYPEYPLLMIVVKVADCIHPQVDPDEALGLVEAEIVGVVRESLEKLYGSS